MGSILQLVQNLMHGDEDEEPQSARYENGCAYFHEDEREGLAKICRLAIHSRYEDFVVDGFNVLYNKKPVVYLSAAARPGLGQYLCNQLGLPFPCLSRVPCNTMFGSQHQMDVALLEKLIKDDIERGKLPLLLVANAGTAAVGHTDKIGRLKELCEQYGIWLHVEGVNLATLALGYVSSSVLSQRLQESLKKVNHIKILVEDELSSPVVVFRFFQELPGSDPVLKTVPAPNMAPSTVGREGHSCDALNRWVGMAVVRYTSQMLGEQLKQLVPVSGLTVMDLEAEGVCVRFSPLMTAAVLGTRGEDVDQLVACIESRLPVLTCTLQLREEFKQEVTRTAGLLHVDDPNWPGIGVVRYEHANDDKNSLKLDPEGEKIHAGLLKKLNELESDLTFKMEVVRKGIQEAQVQLQKANEERLLEEGVLRQIPVVGSVLNWFSPVQPSQKGRTFNLTAGSLESTEHTYVYKVQDTGVTPPQTPTGTRTKLRFPGQKPFKKSLRGSDALSETSSVSHIEDLEKMEHLSSGQEQEALEANSPEQHPGAPAPQEAEQTGTFQNRAQGSEDDRPQVEEPENLR
ncbi:Pyridoxal-dependent decarboxylase domain-containing protein 1 [Myotis brandtii]|uniref:Pyridoxal-dependent decarboxylase domain-containing protein 1 n=1 Tax=Myotis brandtii TaxID=109478 RepID=S7PKA8_MYOBR|nr:Pyridoxal-dependent decarboxylase domain-containing protein 1 [Myotis brandtii]